jgi:C4-dicarboxylate-specific signal transduction histidine kinase
VQFADGRIKWILSRGRTVRDRDGRALRLVGVKVDNTARKTAELQMQEQRRELLQLSRVNVAGEMSTALAHEVNQPLAAILMNASVARRVLHHDPPNLGELEKIVEAIVDDNRQAAAVILKCGALVRPNEPGQVSLCVNAVVRSFLDVARIDIISRGVSVTRDFAESLPAVVGDPVQLQQVFLNLVINACEAMESKPPKDRRLHLATASDAGGVRITVRDTGTGVPPDERNRIFEPFVTSKTRRPGLGLAICNSIVSAHRGRLWIEDVPEGGTRFVVWLPSA